MCYGVSFGLAFATVLVCCPCAIAAVDAKPKPGSDSLQHTASPAQSRAVQDAVKKVRSIIGRKATIPDAENVVKTLDAAAAGGDAEAQASLGILYAKGIGVEKNDKKALTLFQSSARLNDSLGQYELSISYWLGEGVARDPTRSLELLHQAAGQGEALAKYSLGVHYAAGQGVPQSYQEAFGWFLSAANQGLANGQEQVAVYYFKGLGVSKNYDKALHYSRLAAEQGLAKAQAELGEMYENGYGVGQDQVLAYALYSLAAAKDPSADNMDNRNRVKARLSSEQVALGQKIASDWRVGTPLPKSSRDYR